MVIQETQGWSKSDWLACFAGANISPLIILHWNQDGTKYVKKLENYLLSFFEDFFVQWMIM